MKPELTQKELANFAEQGKTAIWQYNTLYQIEFCQNLGNGEYYLRQIYKRPRKGVGVTLPGRFFAMAPNEAAKYR
jgi:hypothetical protein